MNQKRRILVLLMMILVSSQMIGQAVPPPIPPPPPPGLPIGVGEYFFLIVSLVFGVREIKKVEDS